MLATLVAVVAASLVTATAAMVVTALVARRLGKVSVIRWLGGIAVDRAPSVTCGALS